MAVLSSKLIISLTDNVSGPARKIQTALDRLKAQSKAIGTQTRLAAGAVTGAGVYGIEAMVKKAEGYNKNIFGVGVASISDNTKKVINAATGKEEIITDLARVKAIMREVADASNDIAKDMGLSPTRISGIAETLAKAGFETEKLRAATKAIAMAALTDSETTPQKLGEFGSVLETIYKPKAGEEWGQFFKRQMNIVMTAADETRLSLGSTMEGMRAFAAAYSQMGNSETTNALLLMAGVKTGGEAMEIGQTLKSNLVRALIPTQEGLQVMNRLQLKRSDYTDQAAMDPMRLTGNLARTFSGAGIKGKYRSQLNDRIKKAIDEDRFDDEMAQIRSEVAKKSGVDMKNADSRARFETQFNNAAFAGGGKFDMAKLYRDLIDKGATPADLAVLFNGRRITSNLQILQGLAMYGEEFLKKLNLSDGTGLDTVNTLHKDSDIGKLRRFEAMIEAFQIKLANSEGFERFLTGIATLFEKLGEVDSKFLGIATTVGIVSVALAPVAVALASFAFVVGRVVAVARGILGLAGVGGAVAAGRGAAGAAVAGGVAGRLFGLGSQKLNSSQAAAAKIASQRILLRMGAGGQMISGMSAAGAAAAGAAGVGTAAGRSLLARAGALLVPGLGLVMLGATAAGGVYEAYKAQQKGGSFADIAKAFGWGALTMGMGGEAQAAGAPKTQAEIDAAAASKANAARFGGRYQDSNEGGSSLGAVSSQAQTVVLSVQSAMDQIRAIAGSVDLTGEGMRMMESLAAGISAGASSVHNAARAAADTSVRNAVRGAYSDGGFN